MLLLFYCVVGAFVVYYVIGTIIALSCYYCYYCYIVLLVLLLFCCIVGVVVAIVIPSCW